MRRIQKSKQAAYAVYLKLARAFKEENPICQAKVPGICTYHTSDVHHKMRRIGALLCDVSNFMAVCRSCHQWIEYHIALAREKGWIIYETKNTSTR